MCLKPIELRQFYEIEAIQNQWSLRQIFASQYQMVLPNIAVSNTDDHLRNHGFLLTPKGWRLSPAFDLNPSIEKNGFSLNIDMQDNALNLDLAKSVGAYFQLSLKEMDIILQKVFEAIRAWRHVANELKIPRQEQDKMESAFRIK